MIVSRVLPVIIMLMLINKINNKQFKQTNITLPIKNLQITTDVSSNLKMSKIVHKADSTA